MVAARQQRRRASALVETAIIVPVFLAFIFGILEFGYFVMIRHMLENAAREGVRFASVNLELGSSLESSTRAEVTKRMGALSNPVVLDGVDPVSGSLETSFSPAKHILVKGYNRSTGLALANPQDCLLLDAIGVEIYAAYKPIIPVLNIITSRVKVIVNVRMTAEYN